VVDDIRLRAPPGHPDGQPASVPVVQGSKRLLITARHGAQQCRVIAILGPRAHARGRSHAPMHSLSQQQASSVPIMHNKLSQDAGQRGYSRSVISLRIRDDIAEYVATGAHRT